MNNVESIKVIKRYANRKLYDPEASSYTTLGEIFKLVVSGQPLRVVSNDSKEDITNSTILSALTEQHKLNKSGDLSSLLVKVADYISSNPASTATTVELNLGGTNV